MHAARAQSESSAFFLGKRARDAHSDTVRATAIMLEKRLIPTFLTALKSKQSEIRDSACIALGKVGGAREVPALVAMLSDRRFMVRQAAVVGLGLTQRPESVPALLAVLEARAEGKKLCGRTPKYRLRAHAAAALGLIRGGDRSAVLEALIRYSGSKSAHRHVQISATVSLGLLVGEESEVRSVVDHLAGLVRARKRDQFVRAHAVVALGRVLVRNGLEPSDEVVALLLKVGRRARSNHVRRSVPLTLGELVRDPEEHPEVVRWLRAALDNARDGATRNFSAVALGQIGGGVALKTLRDAVIARRNEQKAFAALGLGLLCREALGDPARTGARTRGLEALRVAFEKATNPRYRSACAIGLGLARDAEAGSPLRKALKRSRDPEVQGHLAVALGMVRHHGAVEDLVARLNRTRNIPRLNQHIAIGLGLMGTRKVIEPLIDALKVTRSAFVKATLMTALGLIGDRSAIEPLTRILENRKAVTHTRAYACVALGAIGDVESPPVLARVFRDHNYLASTVCLMELSNIF